MKAPPPTRDASASHAELSAGGLALVAILALVWGFGWPVMKLGVAELKPLTFRSLTLPFAALAMFAIVAISGHSIRPPRGLWRKLALLGFFNVTVWNGLVLYGVQQLPAGRSAIIAYTMPVWSVVFSLVLLNEPLSRRKMLGVALGVSGMALLLGEDIRHFRHTPFAALFILTAAVMWAFGTVLLRLWKPPMTQQLMTGWMLLLGWLPLCVLAVVVDSPPAHPLSMTTWFAILYNIFLGGALAHWAWFSLARSVPVVVSSMSSLPVPLVGVFSGMLVLGERPGVAEWSALALVLAAMVAVLWPAKASLKPRWRWPR